MCRRSSSAPCPLMSLSPMWIEPDVGSISRLIIFSDVVLPQPEGPTNITISPAGMTRLSPSTAAECWPTYFLVTFSRRISAPLISGELCSSARCVPVVVMSDPDSLRDGEPAEEEQEEVEDQGDDHDPDGGAQCVV